MQDKEINVGIEKDKDGFYWMTMDGNIESRRFDTYELADEDATKSGFIYREPLDGLTLAVNTMASCPDDEDSEETLIN